MRLTRMITAFAVGGLSLLTTTPALANAMPHGTMTANQIQTTGTSAADLPILSAQKFQTPVNLTAGTFQAQRSAFQIRRTLPVANIRANPVTTIGASRVNFRPMLDNPQGLISRGRRLGQMPQLIEVRSENLEIAEVPQGVMVFSQLKYALKPGACRDNPRRAAVAEAGASCFVRQTDQAMDAAYSNPRDPRYIADTRLRNRTLLQARTQRSRIMDEARTGLSRFRTEVATQSGRSNLVAKYGEAEVQRLAALPDDNLADEIANTAETTVSEVYFIPTQSSEAPASSPGAPVQTQAQTPTTYDIGPHLYLAGFTLGREYVWSQRIETTVDWCGLGCYSTYFVEAGVRFAYGFGLRIPIELSGTYTYDPAANSARLTPTIRTFNGAPEQYLAAGLAESKLFNGKELVAEIGAGAWAAAKLPLMDPLSAEFSLGVDLTNLLQGTPLQGGQFAPPMPNTSGTNASIVLDSLDLLGSYGSFGIAGVKVFPAVQVNLTSDYLTLNLRDPHNGSTVQAMSSGRDYALKVGANHTSRFSVENPKYGLSFGLTPGINARAYVDLAVWGAQWDFPVWFPQLAVTLASMNFDCHDGTTCSRTFTYTPQGGSSVSNTRDGLDVDLDEWSRKYDANWRPLCLDNECRAYIAANRLAYPEEARKRYDDWKIQYQQIQESNSTAGSGQRPLPASVTFASLSSLFAQAEDLAHKEVDASYVRRAVSQTGPMITPYIDGWREKCKDEQCRLAMPTIVNDLRARIRALAQASPRQLPEAHFGRATNEFNSRLQANITASEQREATRQGLAERNYQVGTPTQTQTPTAPRVNIPPPKAQPRPPARPGGQ